jgi:hypothetical protein
MAGLRLDLRNEATAPRRAGAPIVPGDPKNSLIIQRIEATGPKLMPPASAHKTLTAAQKQLLTRWVAEGAQYEGHWAYQPLRPVPGSIDTFINRSLAIAKLTPAPAADRATLLRLLDAAREENARREKRADLARRVLLEKGDAEHFLQLCLMLVMTDAEKAVKIARAALATKP